MTERQIQDILSVNYMSNPEFKIPGLYIYYWESDLILVSKAGYAYEFEIKISKSDFNADFKKTKRHKDMNNPQKDGPNYFYYVCPEGVIDPNDVPKYAGLIYVKRGNRLETQIGAPKLRTTKFNYEKHSKKFYYNWIAQRNKVIEIEAGDPKRAYKEGHRDGSSNMLSIAEVTAKMMCPHIHLSGKTSVPLCRNKKVIGDSRREYAYCHLEKCEKGRKCLSIIDKNR